MSPEQLEFGFNKWISVLSKPFKIATWVLGVISSFGITPPVPLDQTKSLVNLSRFVIVVLIVCFAYFTYKFQKHCHAINWVIAAALSLSIFLGGWFLNDYLQSKWMCKVSGQWVVMGDERTEEGEWQRPKSHCQKCEDLIYRCGHNDPTSIWKPEGIERHRRMLILLYFALIPILVLCITSVVQALHCLKQPDPRQDATGFWKGQISASTSVTLELNLEPNKKGVRGRLFYQYSASDQEGTHSKEVISIIDSQFQCENLTFSTIEKTGLKKYRMIFVPKLSSSTLERFNDESKKFFFLCRLTKTV